MNLFFGGFESERHRQTLSKKIAKCILNFLGMPHGNDESLNVSKKWY